MPGPAFTSGDRVSLHPIEDEDHEFIQYGRNHSAVRVPFAAPAIMARDDVAESLENAEYRFLICRSTDADESEPLGVVGFGWVMDETRIGWLSYWIAPEQQGNGYVTEGTELFLDYVFRERGFHKVNAGVAASNDASVAVLEKLGFEREGTRRREQFVDGEWGDSYTYGLLADEWLDR